MGGKSGGGSSGPSPAQQRADARVRKDADAYKRARFQKQHNIDRASKYMKQKQASIQALNDQYNKDKIQWEKERGDFQTRDRNAYFAQQDWKNRKGDSIFSKGNDNILRSGNVFVSGKEGSTSMGYRKKSSPKYSTADINAWREAAKKDNPNLFLGFNHNGAGMNGGNAALSYGGNKALPGINTRNEAEAIAQFANRANIMASNVAASEKWYNDIKTKYDIRENNMRSNQGQLQAQEKKWKEHIASYVKAPEHVAERQNNKKASRGGQKSGSLFKGKKPKNKESLLGAAGNTLGDDSKLSS